MLCTGDIGAALPALHIGRQSLRLSSEVTFYTNGNEKLADDIRSELEKAPAPMKVDARKIARLSKALKDSEVTVHFEDGEEKTEGFLSHKPKWRLRGKSLVEGLGLELTPKGTIKVNPPFNQTSVTGIFAAGDAASPMQAVTMALSTGTAAGGGAPAQLQSDKWGQPSMF